MSPGSRPIPPGWELSSSLLLPHHNNNLLPQLLDSSLTSWHISGPSPTSLKTHLTSTDLFEPFQSSFRSPHSAETAFLKHTNEPPPLCRLRSLQRPHPPGPHGSSWHHQPLHSSLQAWILPQHHRTRPLLVQIISHKQTAVQPYQQLHLLHRSSPSWLPRPNPHLHQIHHWHSVHTQQPPHWVKILDSI